MYSDMFKLQLVCMARLTISPCECSCAEQYETWNKFLLRLLLFRVRQILTIAYLLFLFPRSIVCTQVLQFTLNCKSRNEIIRRLNWTFFIIEVDQTILQKDTHTLPNSNCSSPCQVSFFLQQPQVKYIVSQYKKISSWITFHKN